jgi:hypothetical protein
LPKINGGYFSNSPHIYPTIQESWEGHIDKMNPENIPEKCSKN